MQMKLLAAVFSVMLAFPVAASAATALQTVEERTGMVLQVLRDPNLKDESKNAIREEKVIAILEDTFDFNVLGRMTLGRNWNRFSKEQKIAFIDLYKQILKQTYLHHLMKYTNEEVVYEKERLLSKTKSEVATSIVVDSQKIPIIYRLILRNDTWGVYDVIIEGVSMVKNYRTQFDEILKKNSPDELLAILREKIASGEKPAA